MHVVATAGHVDHGKSSLVRALTGMEPDRWAEERRRGLTIDLGFAWTTLATGDVVAFVDVPGHERFVTNMLAGVGSVPAALLVVAADEGWMPQTDEHVRALDALGVRDGLLVVTKCDLADPQAVIDDARRRLAGTTLREIEPVAVDVVPSVGVVGGGGAPGVKLPGWAVALPESYAAALRTGEPCVVGRVEAGRCLLDLRCIPPGNDADLVKAVLSV